MDVAALLLELYGRIPPLAQSAVEGVDLERLVEPPAPGANTIAWLVWHLARVQDDHVAEILGEEQLWASGDWARHFGLDPDPSNTGYGHSAEEVAAVRPDRTEVLLEYLAAVDARTRTLLESLVPADLDHVVDRRWEPPVTLGVRLISIADDSLQHLGQAAWVAVGEGPPDLAVVDSLARMQLAARRLGGHIQVRDLSPELEALLDLAGLRGQVGGQAEGREELGVEEGVEPGDPVA